MMTKEEVMAIVAHCEEQKISFKQRLEELGVPAWSFYDAKKKYLLEPSDRPGGFLQLLPGSFTPVADMTRKSQRAKNRPSNAGSMLSIEMKTATGTMLRIQGEVDSVMISAIIQAAGGNVQSR